MTEIQIPHDWMPRGYQLPFMQAMDSGKKRACLVWHRRAGKDSTVLNFTAKKMFERVGNYWHLFPKQRQARKAIWNGVDGEGKKILTRTFPPEIIKRSDSQEMMLEVANGSTWQLCGSDNYDSLVGSNPVGVVFSEWSLCDPMAWNYVRPMLAENGGWAVFIYTPRGKNHGFTTYKTASRSDEWYCNLLTANTSKRHNNTPVISPEIINQERDEGMAEELIQQEYFCSFDAQIPGAIYSQQLAVARDDGRIRRIPIDPALQVHTAWDLGISDAMSIWFFQAIAGEIRLIHYFEDHNKGMEHYIQYLNEFKAKHQVSYGTHYAPHDIEVRELMSGKSRKQTASEMGIRFKAVQRPKTKAEGHQAVRRIFPQLFIDDERAELGLSCLSSYQYEWDDKKKVFKDSPLHDWASHGADALQTLALGFKQVRQQSQKPLNMRAEFNVW